MSSILKLLFTGSFITMAFLGCAGLKQSVFIEQFDCDYCKHGWNLWIDFARRNDLMPQQYASNPGCFHLKHATRPVIGELKNKVLPMILQKDFMNSKILSIQYKIYIDNIDNDIYLGGIGGITFSTKNGPLPEMIIFENNGMIIYMNGENPVPINWKYNKWYNIRIDIQYDISQIIFTIIFINDSKIKTSQINCANGNNILSFSLSSGAGNILIDDIKVITESIISGSH